MNPIALVVFIAFVFVWYFPVWLRQGMKNRLPKGTVFKSIALGFVPGFLAIIVFQILFGYAERKLNLSGTAYYAVDSFICAALTEELIKFFAARLIIRKVEPKRKVDYALVFGAVGLGYEAVETFLGLDSVWAGIIRGVFALHIIWQLWMGLFYWEYRQAKERGDRAGVKKNLALVFLVPIFFHGMNDFLAFMAEDRLQAMNAAALPENFMTGTSLAPEAEAAAVWFLILFGFMIVQLVYQIVTFRMALKTAKQSRAADAAAEPAEGEA